MPERHDRFKMQQQMTTQRFINLTLLTVVLMGCQGSVRQGTIAQVDLSPRLYPDMFGLSSLLDFLFTPQVDDPQPPIAELPREVTTDTVSGAAEIALATHLTQIEAKVYGAYWCPHCHDQADMFGAEAFALIDYVECDADGVNSQYELCRSKQEIQSYPVWEIEGQFYAGVQSLEDLAALSNYTGNTDFVERQPPDRRLLIEGNIYYPESPNP
ncbi:MAG: hypothetical protein AAGH78_17960 [Cyanobacteria bacterium P01_H01_bin.58]